MSIENERTRKPSGYPSREGCQEARNQPSHPLQRSGGVSGDGMLGRVAGVIREICARAAQAVTGGTTLPTAREADPARAEVGVRQSSVDPVPEANKQRIDLHWSGEHIGEPRPDRRTDANLAEREQGDGPQGILTPTVSKTATGIRKLQRTLYRQAKSKPKWKAWSLYGDLCRRDLLEAALQQVIANKGAPGVDGMTIESLAENPARKEAWLANLQEQLQTRSYRPAAIRRVYIPKGDGKLRPLGIPTVTDRVVQTAVVMLLLPIFEADFDPNSFAYRPRRGAKQAVEAITRGLMRGKREVVDADISGYFDNIPHQAIMRLIKGRVSDGSILALVKAWLRAPIEERTPTGGSKRTINRQGTPQGGVISPLLANLFLDRLDKAVNRGKVFGATLVRYADDFVILCRKGQGSEILRRVNLWMSRNGLQLNTGKTRLVDFTTESFEFLGFRMSWRKSLRSTKHYVHCEASPKSCAKLRERIRQLTIGSSHNQPVDEVINRVNAAVRGWVGYFHHGNSTKVFSRMQWSLRQRIRGWLWRRHGCREGFYSPRWSDTRLHQHYGLIQLPLHAPYLSAPA